MTVIEEIINNKEELIVKLLEILEGKETKTKITLDGVEFKFGKTKVKAEGDIELTIVPFSKEK